ncbi:MAG: Protein-export protein SecB (maintains pre-export unfolded state), partial [uncultured Craurococcus sp.]
VRPAPWPAERRPQPGPAGPVGAEHPIYQGSLLRGAGRAGDLRHPPRAAARRPPARCPGPADPGRRQRLRGLAADPRRCPGRGEGLLHRRAGLLRHLHRERAAGAAGAGASGRVPAPPLPLRPQHPGRCDARGRLPAGDAGADRLRRPLAVAPRRGPGGRQRL